MASGSLVPGGLTTSQRDSLVSGRRAPGSIILNTSTNKLQWNAGSDAAPLWQPVGLDSGGVASASQFIVSGAANSYPRYEIDVTDGAIDAKNWDVGGSISGQLFFRAVNDAKTSAVDWLTVKRGVGTAISSITFASAPVTFSNGVHSASDLLVYHASGDAQPQISLVRDSGASPSIRFGLGGSTAQDTVIERTAAGQVSLVGAGTATATLKLDPGGGTFGSQITFGLRNAGVFTSPYLYTSLGAFEAVHPADGAVFSFFSGASPTEFVRLSPSSGVIGYGLSSSLVEHYASHSDAQPQVRVLPSGQIQWGPGGATAYDVSLFRGGAGYLQLGGYLNIVRSAGGTVLQGSVSGDSFPRASISTASIGFGPGNAAPDTTISRIGAGTLKASGWLRAANAITAGDGTAQQVLVGDDGSGAAGVVFGNTTLTVGGVGDTSFTRILAGHVRLNGTNNSQIFTIGDIPSGGFAGDSGDVGLQLAGSGNTPATPGSGGVLYVVSGTLRYKGSNGTVTNIAPA